MTQNPIVPDPDRKVIATEAGGSIELQVLGDHERDRQCEARPCSEAATTIMVGHGKFAAPSFRYCANHGVMAMLMAKLVIPMVGQ